MPSVKFDVSQHEEVGKYLGVAIEEVAEKALLATALRIVQRIASVVIPGEPRPPIDRRIYAAGWRARKVRKGAKIENTVPHAGPIEWGVRAGRVKISRAMIEALTSWVKRKGLVKKVGSGKAAGARQDSEARAAAWAIAKSMTKKGIFNGGKGLRILEKALKMVSPFFREELKREIKRTF